MFNVLLDILPESYEGYGIDTDFETGIQITQALEDKELTEQERMYVAFGLLYKDIPENFDTAYNGLKWFLSSWNNDNHTSGNSEVTVMDFDVDQWRIYAAFRSQYNINLNSEKMHFWEFMALLANLGECSFTKVIEIRGKKITAKMSAQEKKDINKAKRIYAIKSKKSEEYSEAEQERINTFLKYSNQSKNTDGK